MIVLALPVLSVVVLWWVSTGAIVFADRRPRMFPAAMAGATLILGAAVYEIARLGPDTSVAGAYLGFVSGLAVWGWLEAGFYLGFLVGPRRHAPEQRASPWRHFGEAVGTTLYHDLLALAAALVLAGWSWGSPNKTALWTFILLWTMQASAKLNVFLGVSNLAEDLLPQHLAFLRHYMTKKPINPFFPASLTAMVVTATLLGAASVCWSGSAFERVGYAMLAALTVLGAFEHWLLVLPVPIAAFWGWGRRDERTGRCASVARPARDPGADPATAQALGRRLYDGAAPLRFPAS